MEEVVENVDPNEDECAVLDDDDDIVTGKANPVFLSPERPIESGTTANNTSTDSESLTAQQVLHEEHWQQRKKHVFILSSAGKPVFSRYGDESDFSELFGILQVLLSMAQSNSDPSAVECLRRVTAGPEFAIHFHTAGELSYVMVTRTEESTKSCVRQLRLLHLQMLSVIPTVNAVLKKSPGYDVRRLFSTADASVMRQLIKRMSWDIPFVYRAAEVTPLTVETRREIEKILVDCRNREANPEDHLYTLLLHRGSILASIAPKDQHLHIDDFLLVLNFTASITATQRGEIWAPICLPRFNDTGYLWCYCSELITSNNNILLVQLATTQEAFPALSGARAEIVRLMQPTLLSELEAQCKLHPTFSWNVAGAAPPSQYLQWFAICSDAKQLVHSAFPPPLSFSKTLRKSILRQFAKLRDKLSILSRASSPLLIHCTDDQTFVVMKTKQFEVTALFLPCVPRKEVVECATKLLRIVSGKESFFTLTKPANW